MKKKILFIINLPPPVYGANVVGGYVRNSTIINAGFECTYINLTTEKQLNNMNNFDLQKIFICLKLYFKVFTTLTKKRFSLCYMTINAAGSGFYKDFIVVVLLKIFRCKIVYHYHNKGVCKGENVSWLNAMYRFQFNNADAILLTPILYNDVKKYVPVGRAHFCANGIPEIEGIDLSAINNERSKKDIPQILFLSNMMKEKGVFVLLEAGKILNSINIKFKMIFVGGWLDINEQEFYNFINANNLQNCVAYEGKKYGSDKRSFFEDADIFVFPTFYHNETFGLVNLEAMQYGLPVISTSEGGIPDVVIDGVSGLLAERHNPHDLADKISLLLNNAKLRNEMGYEGKRIYEERFTLKVFEKTLLEILQNLIKRDNPE